MSVTPGHIMSCRVCGEPGHTNPGCPAILAQLYPMGTRLDYATVIGAVVKRVVLRCDCGAYFSRAFRELSRYERRGNRVACGRCGVYPYRIGGGRLPREQQDGAPCR